MLVPLPLALPVSLRPRRIPLAQLPPVVRVFRTPLLRAVHAPLPINRIGGDFVAMVIVAASPLAGRITASGLGRLKLGWLKRTLAIAADPFSHEPVFACQAAPLPGAFTSAGHLETHVEYVPRPRQWVCFLELQNRRKCCCFIPAVTVYCVDEKTGIQALDRTQPGLPIKKGKCGTRTHDYKRHGTTDLVAAYNIATGEVIGECHAQHTNQEFLSLLRHLKRRNPTGEVHIILDNGSPHRHQNVQNWLKRNKRFHFHFIPTSSSWSNLVERFFGLLTSQCIRRGVFHSVQQLQITIQQYIERHNCNPKPFQWKATVEQIVTKIQRAAWKVGVALPWMQSLPAVAT